MSEKYPLLHMHVTELMAKDVVTATSDTVIYDAIEQMSIRNIGAIVVIEDDKPVGIVTERDVLKRVLLGGLQVRHARIKSIFTPKLTSVSSKDTVKEVCEKMHDGNFRHMPVVDDGKLVGMVSAKDVINVFAEVEDG